MGKVVRFRRAGDADVLELDDIPPARPGEGEVRIRVQAIGLNRGEVMFRSGQYLEQPVFPSRIGSEATGVVDAVGPGVEGWRVGDRASTIPAFSQGSNGVYGEWAVVPAHAIVRPPDNLSAVEAASVWVQYLTGYFALAEVARVQAGQHVLVTAATGSTGHAAIKLARLLGAVPIATTRAEGKRQSLLDAGAEHVVVTGSEELAVRVMALTGGKGADVIYDPVAGPEFERLGGAAAVGGTILLYGGLASGPTVLPLAQAFLRRLKLHFYSIFEYTTDSAARERGVRYVGDALRDGRLVPTIAKVFPSLSSVRDAHRYMESNQHSGKVAVQVE